VEPISLEDIPYMNSLPSPILGVDKSSQPAEEHSLEIQEATPSPETTLITGTSNSTDTASLVPKAEFCVQTGMDSVPVHPDRDHGIAHDTQTDTFENLEKRARSDFDDEEECQQPPKKKAQHNFVAVWDKPEAESVGGTDTPCQNADISPLNEQELSESFHVVSNVDSVPSPSIAPNITTKSPVVGIDTEREVSISGDRLQRLLADMNRSETQINNNIDTKPKKEVLRSSRSQDSLTVTRYSADETIELRVGPKSKCVLVHKHILTKSPYFANLFDQFFKDKISIHVYHCPDFDTYSLATIIHWLYHSNIASIAIDYKADEIFNTTHLVKVYCLCSTLKLRSLMNLAIELLGHGYLKDKSAPTIGEIDTAYSQTAPMSGLRLYMATWAKCRERAPIQKFFMAGPWDRAQFEALCKKHPDISADIQNMDEVIGSEGSMSLNPRFHQICWYHDHPDGEECGVAEKTFDTASNGMESRLHEPV
jgi:hypothetical protein